MAKPRPMIPQHRLDGEGFKPGRLWSLWEMIEELGVADLLEVARLLLTYKPQQLGGVGLSRSLQKNQYEKLLTVCETLGFAVPAQYCRDEIHILGMNFPSGVGDNTAGERSMSTLRAVEIELRSRSAFILDPPSAKLFKDEQPFGREVSDGFGSRVQEDIAEAAKALALGLGTAAVFHLMRAMEGALQRLAAALGIENVERVWGNLLSDMAGKIEGMPKGEARKNGLEFTRTSTTSKRLGVTTPCIRNRPTPQQRRGSYLTRLKYLWAPFCRLLARGSNPLERALKILRIIARLNRFSGFEEAFVFV